MAALVLHLGQQRGLAAQAGGAGQPAALRQLADDLAVGVLADLADQGAAVGVGHPVVGLDPVLRIDAGLELGHAAGVLDRPGGWGVCGVQGLGIHA